MKLQEYKSSFIKSKKQKLSEKLDTSKLQKVIYDIMTDYAMHHGEMPRAKEFANALLSPIIEYLTQEQQSVESIGEESEVKEWSLEFKKVSNNILYNYLRSL